MAGLTVPRVSRLLGCLGCFVASFHHSCNTAAGLVAKQKGTSLRESTQAHYGCYDIKRWNSNLDISEHHLKQQVA